MTADLTPEILDRLKSDDFAWLTTVAKSGQPVPKLVWFLFDGTDIVVYTEPGAAKVRHIGNHPQVSLNLDSDGNGGGIIVIGGPARIDAEGTESPRGRAVLGEIPSDVRSDRVDPVDGQLRHPAEDQHREGVDDTDGVTITGSPEIGNAPSGPPGPSGRPAPSPPRSRSARCRG